MVKRWNVLSYPHYFSIPIFQVFLLLTSNFKSCNFLTILKEKGGNNSAVECNLAKVEVAGSNPVSRSRGGIAKW
jgi:hypothetical protein